MQEQFEELINGFLENKVGIVDQFIKSKLAEDLKIRLLELLDDQQLFAANTGQNDHLKLNAEIRSDSIYWLDRQHNNIPETAFLNLISDFVKYLNMSCYTGITDCEFHYSIYEKGSFYTQHLDQFQNNDQRQYSMISYLNADWSTEDGGELLVYQENENQKIAPISGKMVFFKSSEMKHEVLLTQKRRLSVTGWLKN